MTMSANFLLLRIRPIAIAISAAGLLACAIGIISDPAEFFQGYLVGYIFWLQFPIGCLGLAMIYRLVGGNWGHVSHRTFEAAALTIPLFALLLIPLLFGLQYLYPWIRTHSHGAINHKELYLNPPFFLLRAAFYFLIWSVWSVALVRVSDRHDKIGDPISGHRLQVLSGPGTVVLFFTVTFAAFDWIMSLEPDWYSTAYGLVILTGQGLAAFALITLILSHLRNNEQMSDNLSIQDFHDLGNLLLTALMLWAYVSFGQYLIIWSGNIREEVLWYIHRSTAGWKWLSYGLIIVSFLIPFLLLLSRHVKRTPRLLASLSSVILLLRFVDVYWLIIPALHPQGLHFHWLYIAAPVAIGGLWIACFGTILAKRPLLPELAAEPRSEPAPETT